MASADRVASLDAPARGQHWGLRGRPRASGPDVEAQLARISAFLRAEGVLLVIIAAVAILRTLGLQLQIAADTWLNLVGGREIFRHGLPHHDTLAVMSRGADWIDQQWLANVFFYAVYAVGGLRLVAQLNILIFTTAIALALFIARRRGASAASVAICALPAVVVAPAFARAEVLVQPLFVILLALLAAQSRRPTKSVLWVVPILVLWANLHGSVVLAAALVAVLGAAEMLRLIRPRRSGLDRALALRATALLTMPWLAVFASPYAPHLVAYYRATTGNSEFPKFLSEWSPASPLSPWGLALILLAGWAAFLIARRPRGLTAFEFGALALTLGAAATAARSNVWFAYAGVLLLPQLVQFKHPARRRAFPGDLVGAAGLVAVVAAVLVVGHSLLAPPAELAHEGRQRALDTIAQVLRSDPNARVFASYDVADWVLFRVPEARGRIAYDGRWEILPEQEMATLVRYLTKRGRNWEQPSYGYRLLVLNPSHQKAVFRTYLKREDLRLLYRDRYLAVFDRG
jgi:hypothetical protein